MTVETKPGNNINNSRDLWAAVSAIRDRVSRLEGKMSVMLGLTIGTFLGVMGLLLERAFP